MKKFIRKMTDEFESRFDRWRAEKIAAEQAVADERRAEAHSLLDKYFDGCGHSKSGTDTGIILEALRMAASDDDHCEWPMTLKYKMAYIVGLVLKNARKGALQE